MLSLCMIVKDEIDYIEECLKKVSPYVDEMIIVDTGSTDGTLEVLEKFDCKVYHFEWCNDFAKARNFSVNKASHNWILFLDADEHVTEFDAEEVRKLTSTNYGEIVGNITIRSFVTNVTNLDVAYIPRIFNKKFFKFERPIHEQIVPKFNFVIKASNLSVTVNHFGYLEDVAKKKDKTNKYKEYLEKSIADKYDPYLVKHLATGYLNTKDFEKAIEIINEVINDTSLQKQFYYPEAVTIKIKALIGLEKYEEALGLQKYYEVCKDSDEFMLFMGIIFKNTKQGEPALNIFEYLINKPELTINRLVVINELGDLMMDYELYEEALRWFEKINYADNIKKKIDICKEKINNK